MVHSLHEENPFDVCGDGDGSDFAGGDGSCGHGRAEEDLQISVTIGGTAVITKQSQHSNSASSIFVEAESTD